jgi:hypothetical protein
MRRGVHRFWESDRFRRMVHYFFIKGPVGRKAEHVTKTLAEQINRWQEAEDRDSPEDGIRDAQIKQLLTTASTLPAGPEGDRMAEVIADQFADLDVDDETLRRLGGV